MKRTARAWPTGLCLAVCRTVLTLALIFFHPALTVIHVTNCILFEVQELLKLCSCKTVLHSYFLQLPSAKC